MTSGNFNVNGVAILRQYISDSQVDALLRSIQKYRIKHDVVAVKRFFEGRSLDYKVIDGVEIENHLPELLTLRDDILKTVIEITGSKLEPIHSRRVATNVNITSQNGEYRWHYDRNDISAILYLNSVKGGEVEVYPNYRIFLGRQRNTWLQEKFDRLLQKQFFKNIFGKHQILKTEAGMLLIFRGLTTLHSVCPVTGDQERICIVFAFDEPGHDSRQMEALDQYLYSSQSVAQQDPNYS